MKYGFGMSTRPSSKNFGYEYGLYSIPLYAAFRIDYPGY